MIPRADATIDRRIDRRVLSPRSDLTVFVWGGVPNPHHGSLGERPGAFTPIEDAAWRRCGENEVSDLEGGGRRVELRGKHAILRIPWAKVGAVDTANGE